MTASSLKAFVLGSGVTVLGSLRCLGRAGVRAEVVSDKDTPFRLSRYYHRAPTIGGSDLPAYLSGLPASGCVLIPCSDRWAGAVARLPEEVSSRFPSSISSPAVLDRFLDKGLFAKLLEEEEVPHPRTLDLGQGSDLARMGSLENVFIKPRDSQAFHERFGEKAFWPDSERALLETVDWALEEGVDVVLQEYIPGPASNHVFVDGFIDRKGSVRAVFARRRLRMHPPRFGNSSYMVSVRRWEVPAAVESITGLLGKVGYRGVFSAEFKWDDRDGLFKLLEVNARPWWFVEFAANCGVNFLEMVYLDALGRDTDEVEEYAVGKYFIHPYYDISACLREAPSRLKGLARFLAAGPGADRPVMRWSDPLPAFAEFYSLAGNFLERRIGREDG